MSEKKPYTYAQAGVSIDAGNALVRAIAPLARATRRPGADSDLGGFGAFFDPKAAGYNDPLLVSSTDGVGTKIKLAIEANGHDTIGIDLVAMCVNDLVVQGAEPLFFLDYFATGKLDTGVAARVVAGIAEGCKQAGCALIGGETAEMPGLYGDGDYDLAGFTVGAVERGQQLTGEGVGAGDVILGLSSSGVHSNGYSLVRRLVADFNVDLAAPAPFDAAVTAGQALLAPTRIYVKQLLPTVRSGKIKALAHITGGGITENMPRVLPKGARAVIDTANWDLPPLFRWLRDLGSIEGQELVRTFNCGIGMAIVVSEDNAEAVTAALEQAGETVHRIGRIESAEGDVRGCRVTSAAGAWGYADAWEAAHDA